jgi:hypothetical protein
LQAAARRAIAHCRAPAQLMPGVKMPLQASIFTCDIISAVRLALQASIFTCDIISALYSNPVHSSFFCISVKKSPRIGESYGKIPPKKEQL